MGDLWGNISFWYSNDQKINIKSFSWNTITIESPVLKDELWADITSYTVMYWTYTLSEILSKTSLLNEEKEKTFDIPNSTTPFTMDLTIEAPDTSKKYYLFVIPRDATKGMGQLSNELWVNFWDHSFWDSWKVWEPVAITQQATWDITNTHWASDIDISLMHISHTINGNEITLTWSDINASKTVEIDVMKPWSSLFEDKVVVNMADEKYVYNTDRSWSYTFRFHAIDCWKQINYTVSQIQTTTSPTEPEKPTGKVTKVPKTGASENILIMLLIAGGFYFGYKKFLSPKH